MKLRGTIVKWNDDKGFGFIAPVAGGKQVFVHISELRGVNRDSAAGTEVFYSEVVGEDGRPKAEGVKSVSSAHEPGPAARAFFVSAIFLLVITSIVAIGKLPILVLWLYLGLSVFTFILYAIDKSAARKGWQRTSESSLHLFALLGGWPGALFAQQLLRHKSAKASFRTGFWITVLLNVAGLGYLLMEQGGSVFDILRTEFDY